MRSSLPIYLISTALMVGGSIAGTVNASTKMQSSPDLSSTPNSVTPIQNSAELTNRMQQGLTALEALTPFGKREFLRGLSWGSKGVKSISSQAMMRELLPDQITALAKVFGVESYVQSLLSHAAKYPPLRLNDPSKQREANYFAMNDSAGREQALVDGALGVTRRDFSPLLQEFDRRFGSDLLPQNLKILSDSDLVLVFDSLSSVAFLTLDSKLIAQQELVFDALQRRGIDTRRDINRQVLQSKIRLREFNQAREFIDAHPDLQDTKIPNIDDPLGRHYQGRSVFAYDAGTSTLTRQALKFESGKQLLMVVDSGCDFSRKALAAINDDHLLAQAVRTANLLILTPPSSAPPLFFIEKWNTQHPDQAMRVAADKAEWQDIDKPGVPMFYVFENGKVLNVVEGWRGQETRDQLLQILGKIGKVD